MAILRIFVTWGNCWMRSLPGIPVHLTLFHYILHLVRKIYTYIKGKAYSKLRLLRQLEGSCGYKLRRYVGAHLVIAESQVGCMSSYKRNNMSEKCSVIYTVICNSRFVLLFYLMALNEFFCFEIPALLYRNLVG